MIDNSETTNENQLAKDTQTQEKTVEVNIGLDNPENQENQTLTTSKNIEVALPNNGDDVREALRNLEIISNSVNIENDDIQEFLTSLLDADVKQEYLDTYLSAPVQSLEKTYNFALKQLPMYFNMIKQGFIQDETTLAKGMIWFGAIGVAAARNYEANNDSNNPVIKAILRYPEVSEEDILDATQDDLHDLMIAICYNKVAPLFPQTPARAKDDTPLLSDEVLSEQLANTLPYNGEKPSEDICKQFWEHQSEKHIDSLEHNNTHETKEITSLLEAVAKRNITPESIVIPTKNTNFSATYQFKGQTWIFHLGNENPTIYRIGRKKDQVMDNQSKKSRSKRTSHALKEGIPTRNPSESMVESFRKAAESFLDYYKYNLEDADIYSDYF